MYGEQYYVKKDKVKKKTHGNPSIKIILESPTHLYLASEEEISW